MPAPGSAQVGGAGEARAELLEEPWKAEIMRAPISMKPVIITPPASPGPGAVIGSLQLSRVRSGHYMDRQTQGAAGDGWGTGGRGRFSESGGGPHPEPHGGALTQTETLPLPLSQAVAREIHTPGASAHLLFFVFWVFLLYFSPKAYMPYAEFELNTY